MFVRYYVQRNVGTRNSVGPEEIKGETREHSPQYEIMRMRREKMEDMMRNVGDQGICKACKIKTERKEHGETAHLRQECE